MSTAERTTPKSRDIGLAPLAAAGVVAVAAAAVTYMARPARRASVADGTDQSLPAYLRDHLSGADAAIQVVRRLAATGGGTPDGHLFRELLEEFEQDRATVLSLLTRLGASPLSPKRAAGSAWGMLASLVAGGAPGDLSLFRTLEALAVGIQGKRCMWRALQALSATVPSDRETFERLESRALRQWERVEQRRRALAATTFPKPIPLSA